MKGIGPHILEVNGVPEFVVLRYDEYQRLLAMASTSPALSVNATRAPSDCPGPPGHDNLVTPTTDRSALPASSEPSWSPLSDDGLIPHEVVVAAVHNHWSLVRAWREHLGLSQQIMAQRLGVSVSDYDAMELEFARLAPPTRERLARGLGIGSEQLVTRRRRRRRTDYE